MLYAYVRICEIFYELDDDAFTNKEVIFFHPIWFLNQNENQDSSIII